jgi:hypothetical protein
MKKLTFTTYAKENGGRVTLLFLLFLLAMYELVTAGFPVFAIICLLPVVFIAVIACFRSGILLFWFLIVINYLIMWKEISLGSIPTSLPNEMIEIFLLALAIINVQESKFQRTGNLMLITLLVWCSFCILEVLNDTCGIGVDVGAWYTSARSLAFQILYAFLVFSLYITTPNRLIKYLFIWGCLALFAVFWVWKQQNIGMGSAENAWLQSRGRSTHILQGGTLIRYFSIYSDAANYGIGIASTAVAFLIFGITSKIRKYKIFFLIVGIACAWGMFPSGTRTGIVCLMAGIMAYVFLSKSFKIAIPVTILFSLFAFILVFTTIGNGNQQIRRMRSAFDKNDASANVRSLNQQAMKKYLDEAPWGIGMHIGYRNVPANNKYTFMATVPPDSEYVFIWIHTGIIGITTFLICTAIMLLGACRIVLFKIKSPSLRGIGAGFCCAMVSQQLGGYGNQVLMQFPNCLTFYGGLALVYILPIIEKEWIEFEAEQLAKEAEKKRLKLEKKEAKRV